VDTPPQAPEAKTPEAKAPEMKAPEAKNTGASEITNTPSALPVVPVTENIPPTVGTGTQNTIAAPEIPQMNASGTLEPTAAVKISQEKGDVAPSPEAQMKTGEITPTPPAQPISTMKPIEREVKYKTPGGLHAVGFNITVTDGKISGVRVTPSNDNEVSTKFQVKFGEEVSKSVIGKTAKDLKIDVVSGASLTTKAFNEFITDISTKGEI
jgi:hypothetical protein